ncbi:hypothetical protein N7495_005560 [Penicillium taxi]|uniref:uncharacterized protein n=1 Tax=Penicillium taxi TaxID=168475 RepID=UPI002544ED8C|nr:uncharacterized protein N7495_005560 [Penicillium taxi]KAJ5893869.1 hypothetical protein N7495_005560 [Penicillium taxi]
MRFLTNIPILLAASATLAAASSGSPKCAAQKVLDQCLQTEKFALENCASSDWDCLCTQSTNVVGCYNNCPDDQDRIGAQTIRQQNCANAKAYDPTTTPTATGTWTSTETPTSANWSATSASATSEATSTTSDDSSDSDKSDSSEPTKALSGLQAKSSPSQGAAAGVAAGTVGWLGVLGFGLGVML